MALCFAVTLRYVFILTIMYIRLKNYSIILNLLFLLVRYRRSNINCFCIGESTACKIIKEICAVIIKVLMPIYLQAPTEDTEEDWINICQGF